MTWHTVEDLLDNAIEPPQMIEHINSYGVSLLQFDRFKIISDRMYMKGIYGCISIPIHVYIEPTETTIKEDIIFEV